LPLNNLNASKDLLFLPLGGAGEIGMNLNLYCYDDQWLMVDLGVTFGSELGIEIIMPDPSYIVERREKLKGLILTHAHEDHIGAVPYLWERLRCPIYATPFTATLVSEKLKEVGLLKAVEIHTIGIGSQISLQPFELQFLTLTHSIPEPNALAIRTPAGTIVHTGDWKLDSDPLIGGSVDEASFKKIGDEGVLALICDSTNVFIEGNAGSEATVRQKLIELVSHQKEGRIIIACFASNVARLESCAIAAYQAGRRPVLVGRSMVRMEQAARANGYLKDLQPFLYEDQIENLERNQTLIICTGSQGEPRSALARMAAGTHPKLKLLEGDTVLFSSRIIPGNEEEIKNMQENLIDLGLKVIDAEQIEHIHVSGHPGREDLVKMYQWIRPQILVPVHGRLAHMREQANLGKSCGIPYTIVPRNGTLINLSSKDPHILERVENGRLALDGSKVVPLFSPQMRDRARLMIAGAVFITIGFDARGHLKEEPMITHLGVFEEEKEEEALEELQDLITQAITNHSGELLDSNAIKEAVHLACRRHINATRAKKPLIVVHLVR
jgi:ribonuclease J